MYVSRSTPLAVNPCQAPVHDTGMIHGKGLQYSPDSELVVWFLLMICIQNVGGVLNRHAEHARPTYHLYQLAKLGIDYSIGRTHCSRRLY